MPRISKKKRIEISEKSSEKPAKKSQKESQKLQSGEASLILRVAKLWGSPEGTVEKHEIDQRLVFDPKEVDAASNFQADVMLIKLKDEITVLISNANIKVNFLCSRCLKPFKKEITIDAAEREFLSKKPSKLDDLADFYFIDTKAFTIDLADMIRQEIILHFPFNLVCSNSCRGLCSSCGTDRNKKACKCKQENPDTYLPFKNLKNLLQ
ncbi:DUF177 domain-containing protein [Candidatus Peregrinibacteria bacterium]|nr:DUF177 domain-containing protein [Candidatus Peregrinibacteria bacterium]